jgi:hypothetical protein
MPQRASQPSRQGSCRKGATEVTLGFLCSETDRAVAGLSGYSACVSRTGDHGCFQLWCCRCKRCSEACLHHGGMSQRCPAVSFLGRAGIVCDAQIFPLAAKFSTHRQVNRCSARSQGSAGLSPVFLTPAGGRAGRSPALGALSRKRRAVPSFLDPRGGRAGRSPALGALSNAMADPRHARQAMRFQWWEGVLNVLESTPRATGHIT